jgi:hypothetical protein
VPGHLIIGSLRNLSSGLFTIPEFLDVIGVGGTTATNTAFGRGAGSERMLPVLAGDQGRTQPMVVLLLRQHVPNQHSQLSGDGDGCDLMSTFSSDAEEESPERTWRFRCSPSGFHQHCPSRRAARFADPSILSKT